MERLAAIGNGLRRLLRDDRGAAGIEFLYISPLLFGVLVFTAEYGQALRHRIALDGAVQDTARFLARTPVEAGTDAAGNPSIALHEHFLAEAEAMLDRRLGLDVAMDVAVATVDTESFRTPFHLIEVTGSVELGLPMLSFVNIHLEEGIPTAITLTAVQQARWTGENAPGATTCAVLDRYSGTC